MAPEIEFAAFQWASTLTHDPATCTSDGCRQRREWHTQASWWERAQASVPVPVPVLVHYFVANPLGCACGLTFPTMTACENHVEGWND